MTAITPSITLRDRARTATGARVNLATVVLVVACLAVWVVSLSRSLFDLMGPDQAFFQYITERAMAGQRVYADIYTENGPGIVAVHWLSTCLFGRSSIAFRTSDACWQLLTLTALVALGARDNRQWAVGWLAATLYVLAYYGYGWCHGGQRDGFAILPILLAVHAVLSEPSASTSVSRIFLRHFLAGGMSLLAFTMKPPLGLCFGVLLFQALADAWWARRQGWRSLVSASGLCVGFSLAAVSCVMILMRLGWWNAYWPLLLRRDPRIGENYVAGHWMVLEMLPRIAVLSALAGLALGLGFLLSLPRQNRRLCIRREWIMECLRSLVVASALLAMLVTARFWPLWREFLIIELGIVLPALGSVITRSWAEQSRAWRMLSMLAGVGLCSTVLQGRFYNYHFLPVLACASYLAACELVDGFKRLSLEQRSSRIWITVCLAALLYTGYTHWWRRMTLHASTPNVLAGTTLTQHYQRVIGRMNTPPYATTLQVAARVRELTADTDPIAVLCFDPWLYHAAQRPPVDARLYIDPERPREAKYVDFFRGIDQRKPKILVARIPSNLRGPDDAEGSTTHQGVCDDLEEFFGPEARVIRERYHITDTIDELCILQPIPPPSSGAGRGI